MSAGVPNRSGMGEGLLLTGVHQIFTDVEPGAA